MKKFLILFFALWATPLVAQNLGQSQSLPYGVVKAYLGTPPTTDSVVGRYQYLAPKVYAIWITYTVTTVGPAANIVTFTMPPGVKANANTACTAVEVNAIGSISAASVGLTSNLIFFNPTGGTWVAGTFGITCIVDSQ